MPAPVVITKYSLQFNSEGLQGGSASESYYTTGSQTLAQAVAKAQDLAESRAELLGRGAYISRARVTQFNQASGGNQTLSPLWTVSVFSNTQADGSLSGGSTPSPWTAPHYGTSGDLDNSPSALAAIRTAGANTTFYLSNGKESHSALVFTPQAVTYDNDIGTIESADDDIVQNQFQIRVDSFNDMLQTSPIFGRLNKVVPNPLSPAVQSVEIDSQGRYVMVLPGNLTATYSSGLIVQSRGFRMPRGSGRDPINGVWRVAFSTMESDGTHVVLSGNSKLCSQVACAVSCHRLGFLYPVVQGFVAFSSVIGPAQVQNQGRSRRKSASCR